MRVLFATVAALRQGPSGPTSDLASARYRVLIPAQQLARLGHQAQIASLDDAGGAWPDNVKQAQCDVLVISKSFHVANEQLAASMRGRGVRVIADICDDYFDDPKYGSHFRNIIAGADQVVASTAAMAESIRHHTGRESLVITDPVEGPRGMPRFAPRLPWLRVAWFGLPFNLHGMAAKRDELRALVERVPVHLSVVTAPWPEVRPFLEQLSRADPLRLRVELVPWSLEATWKTLADADMAWIPVDDTQRAAVKSPNRLLEALWAGRFVAADAVPAYQPFGDLVPVGAGLARGVLAALDNPGAVEKRIGEAQRRVARAHSSYACGLQWAAAIGDTGSRALRLNLGCGDKILPGYVNVDVVEARAGMRPDVICDLHDLAPFADASADEILSVHVVEHFWRWEVRDVLREWSRVLKPGGRMVIECPNVLSACRTFLENPERYAREDQNGQRTMWVFYGDPKWKDPLMNHRWGYTPESLKELLAEVGLAEIRQEPAQFKLREPRDMRVVGIKP
jgi:SAM-dependent methyltransferase